MSHSTTQSHVSETTEISATKKGTGRRRLLTACSFAAVAGAVLAGPVTTLGPGQPQDSASAGATDIAHNNASSYVYVTNDGSSRRALNPGTSTIKQLGWTDVDTIAPPTGRQIAYHCLESPGLIWRTGSTVSVTCTHVIIDRVI